MGFHKLGWPLGPRARMRGQPPFGHQCAQWIVPHGRAGRNDVRHRPTTHGHAHLLTPGDRSQSLAQRRLQLANTNLTHVVTIPAMRPQVVYNRPPKGPA
jgi:hypothetical protein